ncbi:MAG: class I SAM-dependent DNA methyltransferase [Planctomycetes bacterium]|nr:class I SAM-dependent DNA methyltransferase [Planctomycetota bacterium]
MPLNDSSGDQRPLTRAQMKEAAKRFAQVWEGNNGIKPTKEESHKQTWWAELFKVYGIDRKLVATFEEPIPNLKGYTSAIDVFYPGVMIAEQKSRGCSKSEFAKALKQAVDYVQCFAREGRPHEAPRYLVISDFERIRVYDLESDGLKEPLANFKTIDLPKNIDALMFIAGKKAERPEHEVGINIKAVEVLGKLHDALEAGGYQGHQLQQFLVRCLFCLFAEDTDIFQDNDFYDIVKSTREDGSDLGAMLAHAFRVLDTPTQEGKRNPSPPPLFENLPYVNGDLFKEDLGFTNFNSAMRDALVRCCDFDWSQISPAVFGSLFQCVMERGERRQVGAHYTSEADIMKVIRSLFLDELERELEGCGNEPNRLVKFHEKISSLQFLDPACGCGNFLVCAYKNLRRLEHECLERLSQYERKKKGDVKRHGRNLDPQKLKVSPSQMHGIEIGEWPARIAEVALILAERQEDQKILHGISFSRLPLRNVAKIQLGNALQLDWNQVLPASRCSFIMGNPPFVGAKLLSADQSKDMERVTDGIKSGGLLDYVSGWYLKSSDYIKGTPIRCAFVSTNSISHGEQVGVLWGELFKRGIKIHFAHRTFPWESEARGAAHVHVVIIGFGQGVPTERRITDYETSNPLVVQAKNISPYLVEGGDIVITNRSTPLCKVPEAGVGNKPIDDSNYLFTLKERDAFIAQEPKSAKYFRRFMGADEFISNVPRWCLWLGDTEPAELRSMPLVMERIAAVRKFREASKSLPTQNLARTPTRFHVEFIPKAPYLLIPLHTSETRRFIPIGYLPADTLTSNSCLVIADAKLFHFGILTSTMHMAWVKQICGRIKSDYRYSVSLVYNNYPFPQDFTDAKRKLIEDAAKAVLDTRFQCKGQTLADLYDPSAMPPALVKAHDALDRAVDKCYRKEPFTSERERVEFLFSMYQKLEQPLLGLTGKAKKPRKVSK